MSKWLDFLQGFILFDTAIGRQRFIETIQKYAPPKGRILETGFKSVGQSFSDKRALSITGKI